LEDVVDEEVEGKDTPEFEDDSYFLRVIEHEIAESEKNWYV